MAALGSPSRQLPVVTAKSILVQIGSDTPDAPTSARGSSRSRIAFGRPGGCRLSRASSTRGCRLRPGVAIGSSEHPRSSPASPPSSLPLNRSPSSFRPAPRHQTSPPSASGSCLRGLPLNRSPSSFRPARRLLMHRPQQEAQEGSHSAAPGAADCVPGAAVVSSGTDSTVLQALGSNATEACTSW